MEFTSIKHLVECLVDDKEIQDINKLRMLTTWRNQWSEKMVITTQSSDDLIQNNETLTLLNEAISTYNEV